MKVILTEKPSVARDIARVLKVSTRHQGYFSNDTYMITWAFGHLIQLADPDVYQDDWKRWELATLPIVPDTFKLVLGKQDGIKAQFDVIKRLFADKRVSQLICATDAGREGELIFRYIYQLSGCKKPVQRLWISSQTDHAILEGFSSLKNGQVYDGLYDSARCRAEADWLVGINATRAYTTKFSLGDGTLSVGRVQTPVLAMIVDRFIQNTSFVPTLFYEIIATFSHPNGHFSTILHHKKDQTRFDKKDAAIAVLDQRDASSGTITTLTFKKKNEQPPLLYDLTALQKDASRLHQLSAA